MTPTTKTTASRKPRAFTGWVHAYDLHLAKVPVHRELKWSETLNGQPMAYRVRVTPLPAKSAKGAKNNR